MKDYFRVSCAVLVFKGFWGFDGFGALMALGIHSPDEGSFTGFHDRFWSSSTL